MKENITRTTNLDGALWAYSYDQRNRLITANRQNQASSPTITAQYAYTYDASDNLVTKVEPYMMDFGLKSYDGWTVDGGTWDASDDGNFFSFPNFYLGTALSPKLRFATFIRRAHEDHCWHN
jgi:YD repeat-containing protein